MSIDDLLWGLVLVGMTIAYGMILCGVQAAKRRNLNSHRKWMTVSCALVGMWLIVYAMKQVMFGRVHFGGSPENYWLLYVPVLIVHTSLAMGTIGLSGTNLVIGIRRLQYSIGAGVMVAGVTRHRQLGHLMRWTFGRTLFTAYLVYAMLFVWFPVA